MTDDAHATPSFKALDEGRLQPVDEEAVVAVTQADRDAAADYIDGELAYSTSRGRHIREGRLDGDNTVQAFARHRHQSETGAALTREGREALIESAARAAMFTAEIARTDVVRPVNGTAPYTVVIYHGHRTEFHDGEWTIEMHRDAGTGKAAAYAQAINDGLFDLAKKAAYAALAQPVEAGEDET